MLDLCTDFGNFFKEKIYKIRSSLDDPDASVTSEDITTTSIPLFDLSTVSRCNVTKAIMKSPTKSSPQDPIPTWLLKNSLPAVISAITKLINASLSSSTVPRFFKTAYITPFLKNSSLDKNIFKNYRPISNLPFLSKVLERIVAKQLNEHLDATGLHEVRQSAYRANHSTETALLRVYNDALVALDNGNHMLLIMLDLSAAFDTLDHTILLNRLSSRYNIRGCSLQWFTSYLRDRTQAVSIKGVTSSSIPLRYGVPQGSALGPILFSLYMAPLGDVIRKHKFDHMFYADDSQIYFTGDSGTGNSEQRLQLCINEIRSWMVTNKLKLNDDKTEVINFSSRFRPSSHVTPNLKIGECTVQSSSYVKNLGVYFEENLTMARQVNNIVKSVCYQIHRMGKIRRSLTETACKRLVHGNITSRLDYCNSVLIELPSKLTDRIQYAQNCAARLVCRTRRREHITPVLEKLHWLPVKFRLMFKVLTLVYRCLHSSAPSYLSELIIRVNHGRALRSSGSRLHVPRVKTTSYGSRAFSVVGPSLWNDLPPHVTSAPTLSAFKTKLKTHLFEQAFKTDN